MNKSKLLVGFKSYIVDKEFQYSYIIRNLILLVFIIASICAVLVFWNKYRFEQGFLLRPPSEQQVMAWAQANNVSPKSPEFIVQFMLQAKPYTFYDIILKPMIVIFFLNVAIIIISGLYFSYKIAGPIHILKNALRKRIETGNSEPLKVKKNDPFHELTNLANLAFFIAENPALKKRNQINQSDQPTQTQQHL